MIGNFELDHRVVQFTTFQLVAKHLERLFARVVTGNRGEYAVFGSLPGVCLYLVTHVLTRHGDCCFDKIANDLLDIAADITDLGELRGLNL